MTLFDSIQHNLPRSLSIQVKGAGTLYNQLQTTKGSSSESCRRHRPGLHHPHRQHRRRLPHLPLHRHHRHRPLPALPRSPRRATQGLRFTQSAAVKNFDPRQHLDSGIVIATDRTTHFAIVAARQAAARIPTHPPPRPGKNRHHRRLRLRRPSGRRDRDHQALRPRRPRPSPHRHPHHGLRRSQQHLHRPEDHRPHPQHLHRLLLRHPRHRPRLPDDSQRNGRRAPSPAATKPHSPSASSAPGTPCASSPPPNAAPSPPTATA